METYYYQQLEKTQKAAYHAIYTGLKHIEPSFSVPRYDGKELGFLFQAVRLDHPEIFYTDTFRYRFYEHADSVEMIPHYMFEKRKILDHQKAMKVRTERIVKPILSFNTLDQVKYIHDFICTSVHYDRLKKSYSHEIIGPLGQGIGVCEGIAKTVKILCDALHIPCIIAVCGNNPEKGIKYGHTWNIVRINESYYHLDATFDNSLGNSQAIRYDYFLLDDHWINLDHEPVLYVLPKCDDTTLFYYKQNKLVFTKPETVEKRILQAAKKGKMLDFQWRGGFLTKAVLRELIQVAESAASKRNLHAQFSVNWAQAVIRVSFEKAIPVDALIEQMANEGEKEAEII